MKEADTTSNEDDKLRAACCRCDSQTSNFLFCDSCQDELFAAGEEA